MKVTQKQALEALGELWNGLIMCETHRPSNTWFLEKFKTIRQYIEGQGWLCKDDKEQAIWQAIQNIKLGSKTDDKLIVEELEKLGFTVIRFSVPSGEE